MKLNTHGDVLVPHPVLQVWSETSAKALSKALSEISAQQAQRDLSDDLLEGAMAIARFVFGDESNTARRRVYHLAGLKRNDRLPVFRIGQQIFARKSTLLRWISERESTAA